MSLFQQEQWNGKYFNSSDTRSRVDKTWTSCKEAWMFSREAATDRTFILPFAIICTLFTFQALSG